MKLSRFKYDLDEKKIALHPADNRDESKMMVLNRKDRTIEHKLFKDIVEYFDEGVVIVFNDTKVFPARRKPVPTLKFFCFANLTAK